MIKKFLMTLMALVACHVATEAQVTTDPSPLQEDSENVVIYFHADEGNKGLMNLPSSQSVYAHTGVITNLSNGAWVHAPTWGNNSQKYLLTRVSDNLYSLAIGNLREYYGVTSPSETILKLAFVFRNANCDKEGKTASGGDIFVDVLDSGNQISLTSSLGTSSVITPLNNKVSFTVNASSNADISLSVNGVSFANVANAKSLQAEYTFPTPGNYTVAAVAKFADGESKTVELNLAYIMQSPQANFPGGVPKMGQKVNGDGSVTFCFAAPQKNSVIMVSNLNNYTVSNDYLMSYQDYNGFRYFWITLPDIDPSEQYIYYYLVDGEYYVGDPYARLVLDPQNDKWIPEGVYPGLPEYPTGLIPGGNVPLAVYQGNINDYKWTDSDFIRPAKDDLIIYELLFRDFTGTEGQALGNGTVKQAMDRLGYLKGLGVNCIELLPIYEFNGNNSWGYNPNFYFAPDKAYGTPDDYKEFINACHENGIAVVLDMVFNQTDGMHPWYQMYPVGQNPFYNMDAPHAYSVLNDWNQGYGLVRDQFKDVVQYWIEEYHFDGYRFDLVKGLGDNDSYANNGSSATDAYNSSRVKNMREIQEWIMEIDPDAYFINENLAGSKEENEMAAFGQLNWYNVNEAGCQYAMGYSSGSSLNNMLAKNSGRTPGSTVSYLESHDEQRLAYKQNQWGETGVKGNLAVSMQRLGSAAAQMIMTPGAHMIWQFSELGNDQNTKTDSGNDTSPKKVLWSYFDVPDRKGLYMNYAELIGYRKANSELFAADTGYILKFDGFSAARYFISSANGKEIYLLINPKISGTETQKVSFGSTNQDDYMIGSCSYGTTPSFDVAAGTVTIPANSYVLIVNKAVVNGVEEIPADVDHGELVSDIWYDLMGARVANPSKGIYIRTVEYSDGTSRSFKIFM